jgi:hypothetical protein
MYDQMKKHKKDKQWLTKHYMKQKTEQLEPHKITGENSCVIEL